MQLIATPKFCDNDKNVNNICNKYKNLQTDIKKEYTLLFKQVFNGIQDLLRTSFNYTSGVFLRHLVVLVSRGMLKSFILINPFLKVEVVVVIKKTLNIRYCLNATSHTRTSACIRNEMPVYSSRLHKYSLQDHQRYLVLMQRLSLCMYMVLLYRVTTCKQLLSITDILVIQLANTQLCTQLATYVYATVQLALEQVCSSVIWCQSSLFF